MLESWLDFHRATLLRKCAGLDDARLRQAAVPLSPLTLLGLLRHMAEVERAWFRRVLGGEEAPPLYYSDEDLDGDFRVTADDGWDEVHRTWHREVTAARETVTDRSLDDLSTGTRRGERYSLRWIYVHMIEEYARHNGHADLIRERVDGTTGE